MTVHKRARSSPTSSERRTHAAADDVVTWVYGVLAGGVSDAIVSRSPRLPDGGPARAIPLGDELFLIVAHLPRAPFEAGTLEAHLQDIDWVGRYASAHHAVVTRLGQRATVLPLRIFTVFESDERAKRVIGRNRGRLSALARRIGARSEWVLRVHRPVPAAPKGLPRTNAESGTAFLHARARAQRERVVRAQKIDAGVTALMDDLTTLADDTVERAVEPGTSALAEVAFLIGSSNVARFKRALTKSSADLRREGCRIALTGPWPVYSFVEMPKSHP